MNILAFFAHPDDETMLAGGTLILLARLGFNIHYLCATRGEGGEVGEIPISSIQMLGKVRENEMRCAVEVLGGRSVTFLNFIDPSVGPNNELYPYTDDPESLAQLIATKVIDMDINAIFTHGVNGEYGHPAHLISHKAARRAISLLGDRATYLYSVSAFFPDHPKPHIVNVDEPAHIILDISPVLDEKTTAALCHRTQHALFVRRTSAEQGRKMTVPEVIISLESLHRVWPKMTDNEEDRIFIQLKPWQIEF